MHPLVDREEDSVNASSDRDKVSRNASIIIGFILDSRSVIFER